MSFIIFALAIGCAWHGFQVGGATGFLYLMGSVVLALFGLAAAGMVAPQGTSRRPPTHPPGWNNRKSRK
jgi:hypothetical protein